MIDYIIVGSGLAGIAFAQHALQNEKTILVFDNASTQSSRIAGGLYNPVILKRFSGLSQAQEQLDAMNVFYAAVDQTLKSKFIFPMPILRRLASIEEQNNWFAASDKPTLSPFLSTKLVTRKYDHIDSPFEFGEVLQTGYADTKALLEAYHQFLAENKLLVKDTFDYTQLEIDNEFVNYKSTRGKHIIFAEGFGMKANPYFNHLPLDGTKGELFTIKVSGLNLDAIIKTKIFIVPLGDDLYKVGATYHWSDKTEVPTEEGKNELIAEIKQILNCNFEIVSHQAGVRPTVKDRKPLLGTHKEYKRVHVLNGLGTRGVMLAPIMAKTLYNHIEAGLELPREIDIKRFKSA